MELQNEIILYQPDSSISLEVRLEDETVWLTQAQMTDLFQRDRTVITRHINNIFQEGELEKKSNVHFLHIANSDKPVKLVHDRFLIIDSDVYFIGGSIKDLGKKIVAFSKMHQNPDNIISKLR